MIPNRSFPLIFLCALVALAACDSGSINRPVEPEATVTPTRTEGPATPTRTFPVAWTSTPTSPVAPTSTPTHSPTLFVPGSPLPTATATATTVPPTPRPNGAGVDVLRAFVTQENTALVEVALFNAGARVGGMQNDLLFDNTVMRLPAASSCRIEPAIGDRVADCEGDPELIVSPCKTLNRSLVTCGGTPQPSGCPAGSGSNISRFRAIIAATAVPNSIPIPNTVLYACDFEVLDRSRLPQVIDNRNLVVAGPSGVLLPEFVAGDGLVTIGAIVASFAAGGSTELFIRQEDTGGFPVRETISVLGQIVGFSRDGTRLLLDDPLTANVAAGTEIFLTLPSTEPTPVVPTPTATAEPSATDVPLQTATPTWTMAVPPTTATIIATVPPTPTASTVPVATFTATATPTAVNTASPTPMETITPAVIVSIASVVAHGGSVDVEIVLDAGTAFVGGVQNDIVFNNGIVRLAGASACRIDPAIGDRLEECEEEPGTFSAPCKTLSRLLVTCGGANPPDGCPAEAGPETSRFRAIIGATAVPNLNPIPTGLLYTCTFDIVDADALPTDLIISKVVASEPLGTRILPVAGVDGAVLPNPAP